MWLLVWFTWHMSATTYNTTYSLVRIETSATRTTCQPKLRIEAGANFRAIPLAKVLNLNVCAQKFFVSYFYRLLETSRDDVSRFE